MAWYEVWFLLELPCWMWFSQNWYKADPEARWWYVLPISLFLAVPACIVILYVGAIFRIMNWANNG